jgi:ribosome biogenesis GTPase
MTLAELGWNEEHAKAFAPFEKKGWKPARLIRDNKITYGALTDGGEEYEVVMGGKVYHDAECDADLPAVGDWVALEIGTGDLDTIIRARLPARPASLERLQARVPKSRSLRPMSTSSVSSPMREPTSICDGWSDFSPS